jgi:hypothetical protein
MTQAVPRITSEFHSLPDIGWYGGAYQLGRFALLKYVVDSLAEIGPARRFNFGLENYI